MSTGLGRFVHHDPRSRAYAAPRAVGPLTSVLWDHRAPVLDQGDLGSCTGNALAQWLNTPRGYAARRYVRRGKYLDESEAVKLYGLATRLDQFAGEYPPTDTGSSGLGVCKAGVQMGYLLRYEHAFGLDHFLQVMQTQPVIVGTDWYESMFRPNSEGLVTCSGRVVGGHEYLALGVDLRRQRVTLLNSWGSGWGRNGRFRLSFHDFDHLLQGFGDVTVPIAR